MMISKNSKKAQFINYRVRVTIQEGRQLVGEYMSFDDHMNLVLGDCEEFRKLPPAKGKPNEEREDRRTLGLVLLRGEEVISMTPEGPPPPEESRANSVSTTAMVGPGLGQAAGRGILDAPPVQAQPGLAGPVRGVGGPAPGMMQPQMSRPPVPASQLSAPPMCYPAGAPPVIRPPVQQMPGFPPQGGMPPRGPPPTAGQFPFPPPGQYGQRSGMPVPPPPMMRGPGIPAPPPPGLGMSSPAGGPVPFYERPRPAMPPPNAQRPPQNQQQ